ncbi:MAG TPA: c-type cytochrome [Terracidiphilus sp.]|nr:c-type cytochrome [Terracidiphilus sp.]
MKKTSLIAPTAAVALFAAAVFAASTVAQAPQGPPPEGARPPRSYPAPTNLKVLPKDLTGQQVHEIMEHWAGDLGVHCDTCHAADPNNLGPNGRPRLNFASDEKDEKQMARIMYTMTEDLKKNYVAKVAAIDKMAEPAAPVTCGTCHRGHLDPEAYTPAPEHPQGAMPNMQH